VQRPISGAFHALLHELQATDAKDLQNILRMDMTSFNILLEKLGESIVKQDTTMRDSISPEECLAVTLELQVCLAVTMIWLLVLQSEYRQTQTNQL